MFVLALPTPVEVATQVIKQNKMKINNSSLRDICRPFLIGTGCPEVSIQDVGSHLANLPLLRSEK